MESIYNERELLVQKSFGIKNGLPHNFYDRDIEIIPDDITYITGFSGSGKSYIINQYISNNEVTTLMEPGRLNTPIINIIGSSFEEALNILGVVGLSEAYIYLRTYQELSDGQKFRFKLAKAIEKKPSIIVIDEFLSNLDRQTAQVVAYNLQRLCRKMRIKLVVATPHDDLIEALSPKQLIILDLNGTHKNILNKHVEKASVAGIKEISVTKGTHRDYEELKKYHYFEDFNYDNYNPEYFVIKKDGICIGVSVFISPYSSQYNILPFFKEVNENLKINIRIIIHPAYRGIGLTKLLLNPTQLEYHYLESRTALGLYMPFHVSSGFEKIDNPTLYKSQLRLKIEEQVRYKNECIYEVESIKLLLEDLCLEILLENYFYYRKIINLPYISKEDEDILRKIYINLIKKMSVEEMKSQSEFFPMASFLKKQQLM